MSMKTDTDEEICVTDNNNNIIAVSGKEYPDLTNEMKNPELIEYFLSFKDILKSYGEADNEKKKPGARCWMFYIKKMLCI